jgi:hypothetical protein
MLILRRRAMLAIPSAKRRVRNLAEETSSRRRPRHFGSHSMCRADRGEVLRRVLDRRPRDRRSLRRPVWSFQSYAWAARFALHFGSRSRPDPGLRSPEVLDEHQLGLGEGDLAEEDPTLVGRDPEREMGEGAFPAEDLNQSDGKSVEYLKGLEVRIATR